MEMLPQIICELVKSRYGVFSFLDLREYAEDYYKGNPIPLIVAIAKSYGFDDCKISIELNAKSSEPNICAWILMPKKMPKFRTQAFRDMRFTVHVAKQLKENELSFEQFTFAIAHEFAHILYGAHDDAFNYLEPAVDILAMFRGFAEYLMVGQLRSVTNYQYFGLKKTEHIVSLGYLSPSEKRQVYDFIKANRAP